MYAKLLPPGSSRCQSRPAFPGGPRWNGPASFGTVTDNSGAVLPGVQVKITNEGTNTSTTVITDAAGAYSAVNLTPGSYSIEAGKAGFTRHVNKGFVLQVSQEARLDIQLAVGSLDAEHRSHR